jgi:hypothetical protein
MGAHGPLNSSRALSLQRYNRHGCSLPDGEVRRDMHYPIIDRVNSPSSLFQAIRGG